MSGIMRVTQSLLDVLELLADATGNARGTHGWEIMKATDRAEATVYGVLDRLEDAEWITGTFEERNPVPGRRRRKLYQLTPAGAEHATTLLAKHRPCEPQP